MKNITPFWTLTQHLLYLGMGFTMVYSWFGLTGNNWYSWPNSWIVHYGNSCYALFLPGLLLVLAWVFNRRRQEKKQPLSITLMRHPRIFTLLNALILVLCVFVFSFYCLQCYNSWLYASGRPLLFLSILDSITVTFFRWSILFPLFISCAVCSGFLWHQLTHTPSFSPSVVLGRGQPLFLYAGIVATVDSWLVYTIYRSEPCLLQDWFSWIMRPLYVSGLVILLVYAFLFLLSRNQKD